jgi:hypothetical protein
MSKVQINMLAQLFTFGIRAIVAAIMVTSGGHTFLGAPQDHLHNMQDQLDHFMNSD